METGLVFGNSEFYINKITIKADDKILAKLMLIHLLVKIQDLFLKQHLNQKL